jgi:hypothetical protein
MNTSRLVSKVVEKVTTDWRYTLVPAMVVLGLVGARLLDII